MSKTREPQLTDLDYIRELAKVFKRYGLDEIEIETSDRRVLLRRGDAAPQVVAAAPAGQIVPAPAQPVHPPAVAAPPVAAPEPGGTPAPAPEPEPEPTGDFITSPLVGTFYRAPRPDAVPFVEVGGRVEAGATVCVVEAMKLFNELEAEYACVIEDVLVENGQAVEFGTKLFRVRKS